MAGYDQEDAAYIRTNIEELVPHDDPEHEAIWDEFFSLIVKYDDMQILRRTFEVSSSSDGAGSENLAAFYNKVFHVKPGLFAKTFNDLQLNTRSRVADLFVYGMQYGEDYFTPFHRKLAQSEISEDEEWTLFISFLSGLIGLSETLSEFNESAENNFLGQWRVFSPFSIPEYKDITYDHTNLVDGDLSTCWAINAQSMKKPYVLFRLDSFQLKMKIANGYQKSSLSYRSNSRAAKIKIVGISDCKQREYCIVSTPLEYDLKDSRDYQEISLNDIADQFTGKDTKYLMVRITQTFPGNKYDDICISEIQFEK